MNAKSMRTIDLIYMIFDFKSVSSKVAVENPKYGELINKIQDLYSFHTRNERLIVKDFAVKIGYKTHVLRKNLEDIYSKMCCLLQDEDEIALAPPEIQYHFSVRGFDAQSFYFNCKLHECPREGEKFTFKFLNREYFYAYFYVDEVEHEVTDTKHIIHITLHQGEYNPYYKMELAKEEYQKSPKRVEEPYDFFRIRTQKIRLRRGRERKGN